MKKNSRLISALILSYLLSGKTALQAYYVHLLITDGFLLFRKEDDEFSGMTD